MNTVSDSGKVSRLVEPGETSLGQVLVIDDEPDIREMVAEVLGDEGYNVAGAANGMEALDYLSRARSLPCLILLDLMMPVMDGWEFVERQRQNPLLARIPLVVVSADGTAAQKMEGLGASGYLRKPIQLTTLLDTVKRYCECAFPPPPD